MKNTFLFIVFVTFCTTAAFSDCPAGLIEDCNGHCVPMAWLSDDVCDFGDASTGHEFPSDSGYYADFSCEYYYCDIGNCTGCSTGCLAGEIQDCNGNCAPVGWVSDTNCDYGQREYYGVAIVFACQSLGCDLGDCSGPCFQDGDYTGVSDLGACCIDNVCSDSTRGDCWDQSGEFMGANTSCQTSTCGCGVGWISDCNGNCFEMSELDDDGYCINGSWIYDSDGDYFILDVDCEALACGLSTCLGQCPGGCCVDGGCETTSTYQTCLDLGGLFLGSYVYCEDGQFLCTAEQKPIQLPNSEIEWSGALGEVEFFPQWLMSEGGILVAGAAKMNADWELGTSICVFRYDVDQWVEEALLESPTGLTVWDNAGYATDGNRIAVASSANDGTSAGYVIDIWVYNKVDDTWDYEQSITDGYNSEVWHKQWGASIDIDGEVLIVGDSPMNDTGDNNGGGVHVYRLDSKKGGWYLEQTLLPFGTPPYEEGDDQYLGMSVALEGNVVAASSTSSMLIYDIGYNPAFEVQQLRNMWGTNWPRHRSIDLDDSRILTHAVFNNLEDSQLVFKIYEPDVASPIGGDIWTKTAELTPFDITGDDMSGHIVELAGNKAMITSPRDNDLGIETGSAYVWEHDGTSWKFVAKLWSDRAVGGDQFGISATLNGSNAYLSGYIGYSEGDNIKEFWPRGIAWINPLGGYISSESNWDPVKPSGSNTVSFSLRSQTEILVDEDFSFEQMFIGPGAYAFNLQGIDRTLGAGYETINIQGVPGFVAELKIKGGDLDVNGDMYNGEDDLPGKISLVSNSSGVMGGLHVDGLYMQHEAGELLIELNTGRPAPAQATGNVPLLNGVLELILADGYVPQDGDIIPLLTSEFIDSTSGQFSIVLINDPLPEGLYIKLNYIEIEDRVGGGTLYAEVDEIQNLFGYGDPNSETVSGEATDLVVADLGSSSRTADGFDDIAVTTADSIYIFMSDGNGGISSQVIYTDPDFTFLSAIDAGDLDGDGTNDLAVTNSSTNTFIPIFNESNDITSLTVGDSVNTSQVPVDILIKDIDGDNDADIIVVCYGYTLTDGKIDFFESDSSVRESTFSNSGSMSAAGNPKNIDPGDVNNDKDFILISFESANKVGRIENGNTGIRTFDWEFTSYTDVSVGPTKIAVGDLNGDGISDAVVVSPESDVLTVMTGNIDGSMSGLLQLYVGDEPTSVSLVDFDHDGDKDIAVVATDSDTDSRAVLMFRNDTSINSGNLMFASSSVFDSGLNPILVSKGDIDGDGRDDLVSINSSSSFRDATNQVYMRKSEQAATCAGDLDGNNVVNVLDLLEVIGAWGAIGSSPQDFNDDLQVNVLDLLILIGAWGNCP